jgi:hypothetical protein
LANEQRRRSEPVDWDERETGDLLLQEGGDASAIHPKRGKKQLLLFAALGVSEANVKEALASFGPGAADVQKERIERLILFTGHRVDGAKREKPRFPAAMEGVA